MNLFGSYHVKLSKNSIKLSDSHSDYIGTECIITKGFDGCLYVFKNEDWNKFAQKFESLPNTMDGRQLRRYFFGNAYETKIQEHNLLVPAELLNQLGQSIVVIGMYDRLELWNESDYEAKVSDVIDINEIANRIKLEI